MYKCPNCAGNLKFDIARQQLYCEYCSTELDPYSFYKEKDAEESGSPTGEYEVTVFSCPQCGGELISEDTTVATFCSFCGASTILDSRISRERRPEGIIPFTKTKEDCRAAYGKMLRRAIFAPKELKDEALIEKFRGIYMPYWVYSFEKEEHVAFPSKITHRKGDYLISEHYQIDCDVEEEYKGLAYDASAAFSDSLSSAIAPFDLRQEKAFAPAFLSGFYTDTGDVDEYVYMLDAEEFVVQDASRHLAQDPVCRKYGAGQGEDAHTLRNALRPHWKPARLAMLPVWFLSYRNGDRVSYAVVNGQTGKAAADLPVDGKRYLAGSLFLAVPLFCLLNLFLTITPGRILLIAALLAFVCILISNVQMTHILARESGEDDKGLSSKKQGAGIGDSYWKSRSQGSGNRDWKSRMGIGKTGGNTVQKVIWIVIWIVMFLRSAELIPIIFTFLGLHWVLRILGSTYDRQRLERKPFGGGHFKEKWPTLLKPFGGIVLAVVTLLMNPVSDWFYYIGAFVCMGMVFWAIMDIIKQHNLLTTRKLPQLNRRGGDEHA